MRGPQNNAFTHYVNTTIIVFDTNIVFKAFLDMRIYYILPKLSVNARCFLTSMVFKNYAKKSETVRTILRFFGTTTYEAPFL